jgi:group I intron endonuclease
MKNYIIYSATNKQNGKMYIGLTTRSLEERKQGHKIQTMKSKNNRFGNALKKYGFEAFAWRVLDRTDSEQEIIDLEKQYIDMFGTNFKHGYNSTSGGEHYFLSEESIKKLRYKKTAEHREKLAESLRGVEHTEERRLHQSLAHLGKKDSEETKMKKSLALKGKPKSKAHKANAGLAKRREVLCVETGIVYKGIGQASLAVGMKESSGVNISNCCRNGKTSAGYHWSYV